MASEDVKKLAEQEFHKAYMKFHPQIYSNFEDEMPKYWGKKWKANTTIGKLRTVLLHRPGKEFLSVGSPTPWAPHSTELVAWRMKWKPENLDALVRDHEALAKAYRDEGVDVIVRRPDPYDLPYTVKSIYTDDVCHPAVYGHVILRMYDNIRKGEEMPTFQTLAEHGIPVVGMITGHGMAEGGNIGWFDEKHVLMSVHYPRSNTSDPNVWRANQSGFEQYKAVIQNQDPEVDVQILPGWGPRPQLSHYWMVDRHTSVSDPKWLDPYLVKWLESEMNWEFIVPPEELCGLDQGMKVGPSTGVVLEPRKILVAEGEPKATKWFESIGLEVVEVDIPTLVAPMNSGNIHCASGSLRRDNEPRN